MSNPILVRYPIWMRIAILFGVVLFLSLSCFLLWQAYAFLIHAKTHKWLALLLLPSGLTILKLSYHGIRLIPFLNSQFSTNSNGVEILFPFGRKMLYEWHQIGYVKDRDILQIFEVWNHNGTLLLAVDYWTHDLEHLKKTILSNIPEKVLTESNSNTSVLILRKILPRRNSAKR